MIPLAGIAGALGALVRRRGLILAALGALAGFALGLVGRRPGTPGPGRR